MHSLIKQVFIVLLPFSISLAIKCASLSTISELFCGTLFETFVMLSAISNNQQVISNFSFAVFWTPLFEIVLNASVADF